MIALIKASAYFHQKQRATFKDGTNVILVADWRDVKTVFKYAGATINASSQGLGENDLIDFTKIQDMANLASLDEFGTADICRWLKVSRNTARNKASSYISSGLMENMTAPPLPARYKLTGSVLLIRFRNKLKKCDEMIENQEPKLKEFLKDKGTGG